MMKLYLVTINFFYKRNPDLYGPTTISIILSLPDDTMNPAALVENNLQWLNRILADSIGFEIIAAVPFDPRQHAVTDIPGFKADEQ